MLALSGTDVPVFDATLILLSDVKRNLQYGH